MVEQRKLGQGEMRPCKACGQPEGHIAANGGWLWGECWNCDYRTSFHRSADEARAAWNRRSSSDEAEVVARVDSLDKATIRLYNYVGVTLRAHGPNPKPWSEQSYEHQLKWRDAVRVVLANASPSAVKAGVTEAQIANVIDPHAFMDDRITPLEPPFDDMVRQDRELALSKARRILALGVHDEGMGGALSAAIGMCEQYAEFIRRVPAADIEQHPYLPELEQVIEVGRLALRKEAE